MLSDGAIEALDEIISQSEARILDRIASGRARHEDDITSRWAESVETIAEQRGGGFRIAVTAVNGLGPDAPEVNIGADLLAVVRIQTEHVSLSKGFLAQAKLAGKEGVHFRPVGPEPDDRSHWLSRKDYDLDPSGTVLVTRPSLRLQQQCKVMLTRTPASYVFVYDRHQIGVTSAAAVLAMGDKPKHSRSKTPLGTKTLSDLFVHLSDCYLGDRSLDAATVEAVEEMAAANFATTGLLVEAVAESTE